MDAYTSDHEFVIRVNRGVAEPRKWEPQSPRKRLPVVGDSGSSWRESTDTPRLRFYLNGDVEVAFVRDVAGDDSREVPSVGCQGVCC